MENAFGIMSMKFRILKSSVNCKLETMDLILKTTCILHNFLLGSDLSRHNFTTLVDREVNGQIIPGSWRNSSSLESAGNLSSNFSSRNAILVRNTFKEYFTGPGSVPWQDQSVQNGIY